MSIEKVAPLVLITSMVVSSCSNNPKSAEVSPISNEPVSTPTTKILTTQEPYSTNTPTPKPTEELKEYDLFNTPEIVNFEEQEETDYLMKDILYMQEAINSYKPNSEIPLGDYLVTTDWYQYVVSGFNNNHEELRFRNLLNQIDYRQVEGEPLQCFQFVKLFAYLFSEINVVQIGGATMPNEDEIPVMFSRDLIPRELIRNQYSGIHTYQTNYGAILMYGKGIDIETYEPGDVGVVLDGDEGHVFIILRKTRTGRGTVLTIINSNSHNDGKVYIETVNMSEYVNKFNPKGNGLYILRDNSCFQK
jgi:hypothetical protein